jgi:hypothetical protein
VAQPPTFYVKLFEMTQSPYVRPRTGTDRHWMPSKTSEGNVLLSRSEAGDHHDKIYRFKHGRFLRYSRSSFKEKEDDGKIVLQRIATTYFSHSGNCFFVVEGDPMVHQIGDGIDSPVNSISNLADLGGDMDTELEMFRDWQQITFDYNEEDSSRINTENAGLSTTLRMTREDQDWPGPLLPRNYHPQRDYRRRNDIRHPSGSFGGNLAILIALVAFTASRTGDDVQNTLQNCITGYWWRTPPRDGRDPHPGCKYMQWTSRTIANRF